MAKIEKMASWLEREYEAAAASLRESLQELFSINREGVLLTVEGSSGGSGAIR